MASLKATEPDKEVRTMGINGFKKFKFYEMRSKAIMISRYEGGMSALFFFSIFLQGRNNWKTYDVTGPRSQKLCMTQGGNSSPSSVLGNICHHIQRLNNYHITLNTRHISHFFPLKNCGAS
jgi:hypothetical protein